MQSIKVKLDKGAYMPERAHADDAGYDIRTPKPFYMFSGSSRDIDTGVHIAIPKGHVGFLKSKSGLNMKSGVTGEGVIDSGYTGSIHVKLYNNGMEGREDNRKSRRLAALFLLPTNPAMQTNRRVNIDTEPANGV